MKSKLQILEDKNKALATKNKQLLADNKELIINISEARKTIEAFSDAYDEVSMMFLDRIGNSENRKEEPSEGLAIEKILSDKALSIDDLKDELSLLVQTINIEEEEFIVLCDKYASLPDELPKNITKLIGDKQNAN